MTDDRACKREASGFGWMFGRWCYARWIQAIALFDLLGRDKRPSQSKLAAFYALGVTGMCAMAQVMAPLVVYLVAKPAGVSPEPGTVSTAVSVMFIASLSASFGMKVFTLFLTRNETSLHETTTRAESLTRQDTNNNTRTVTETIERQIVADPDGDFEPTP